MTVSMTEPEVSTSNHVISDIFKEKLVIDWDCDDVYSWLISCGFKHYANLIAYEHNVDGMVLLSLKEADLRNPPLALTRLGDIKKLCKAFAELRSSLVSRINHSKTSDTPPIVLSDEDTSSWLFYPPHVKENSFTLQNGGVVENIHERQITTTATNLQNDKQFKMITKEELIRRIESPDTHAKSLIKLLLAFIYCSLSLLTTSFVMVVVHDRVPDMKSYPPLPDLILDNIPLIPWAFEACELIGVIMTTIMTTVLIFHKHRVVITRRMFSVVGTVFLLRCITMFVTSLSVPGSHLECSAKTFGSLKDQLYQAYHIWSHMGMSIQGVRTCGDYMFSGHTTVITLLNHFITEYTDESWYGLHTTSWVLNLFAMFFILAGHEHYSIDVFIAFYISSRMFLYYHAYAYNHSNITSTDSRMRVWYPLAWFFESGGLGRVPNEFGEPFSLTIPTWRSEKKDDEMIFVEEHKVQEAFEIRKKKN